MTWTELETSTYQHHVIQHVIGATVLGWFKAEDAVHFVLDVGLLWTVYVNAEMNLMALFVAIEDLESDELPRQTINELLSEAQLLLSNGRGAGALKYFKAATVECLVAEVELFSADAWRRIVVTGDSAKIEIVSSMSDSSITIHELVS